MKAIVFGGAGFLGSHTADVLTERGYEVIVFDTVSSPYLRKGQRGIVANILDTEAVITAMTNCDVAYHFAGITDIDKARTMPVETVRTNVLGTTMLLESARQCGIGRFVFASSLYVYSASGSFYRASKQACELLIENYHEVFGLDFTILRYGSLYGPRAGDDNWIQTMLKQALSEGKIVRQGDGEELREYVHVHDAARLGVDALDAEYANQHVIVTGNQQMKIRDLLTMIREMMGGKVAVEYEPSHCKEHYEITPYVFKPTMAKRITGRNYVDLGQGLYELLGQLYAKGVNAGKKIPFLGAAGATGRHE